MSELCIYELEDHVWDEFGATDDHIVPFTISDYSNQFIVQSNSCKKPRHEIMGGISDAASVTKYDVLGKEKKGLLTQVKDTMLEKNTWSHTPDGAFPDYCNNDSLEEEVNIASDHPTHELENGKIDCVSNEFCAAEDNVYCYPLNHGDQTEDDLDFFNNGNEGKDSSELLYYNWPDIGNFEDVDRMFRSCDSMFGVGSLSNEDDLCWFSSSHDNEGSQDVLKSNAKLDGVPQQYSASEPDSAGHLIDDPSDIKSRREDDVIPNEKISQHKLPSNQLSQSEERKEQHLDNGVSFHRYGNIVASKQQHGDSSCQAFSPSNLMEHKQKFGYDSLSYVQNDFPYMHLSNSRPSEQISFGLTVSGTTSENNGCHSSTKESSYESNHIQSTEISLCPSFEAPTNERKVRPHHQKHIQASYNGNFKHGKMGNSARKLVLRAGQDGCSKVGGGSIGMTPDRDSSNVQESSCMSSALDEISLEATSFHQLQQVMEKLDIRTKLCIRDSLYRLARSAEQRHNCASTKGSFGDDKGESAALIAEETNKCTGFMDIETDTNPIDRSIAHLLFHRPSDPSVMHANGTLPFKSNGMIHGSLGSPPVITEKFSAHEDTGAAGLQKKMPLADCK